MAAMRHFAPRAGRMAGMRPAALSSSAARRTIYQRCRRSVVASPQIMQPNAVSRSPLEGDCRPSRADITKLGPQGPGFLLYRRKQIPTDRRNPEEAAKRRSKDERPTQVGCCRLTTARAACHRAGPSGPDPLARTATIRRGRHPKPFTFPDVGRATRSQRCRRQVAPMAEYFG